MKPGTPGFIGDRLRQAREARGLNGIGLADVVNVTRQAISQYETGQQTPRPEVLQQIASVLRLPVRFFVTPFPAETLSPKLYRCLGATTKTARESANAFCDWLHEITIFASQFITMPRINIPQIDVPSDPLAISNSFIETAAEKCRRQWGMQDGPISNMVWLLENNGAVVARFEMGVDDLDGLSCVSSSGRPYIILASDKRSAVRSRFDIAHELGHIILHRAVNHKQVAQKEIHALLERQAHRFAASFLLPQTSFAADISWPTLDAYRTLKEKWKVSIGTMIMRSVQLGFISETQEKSMWINYSRRGWKRREPLDEEIEIEQPRLFKRVFEMISNGIVSNPADILAGLHFGQTDIEKLTRVAPSFFENKEAQIYKLPLDRKAPEVSNQTQSGHGSIIQFPRNRSND